ncbi:ankyrin repeat-containing domain protein [Tricharina praecox]|uniref:ankyrin repeat-containing domain protein n=1 Tax=Tricharina praecox TaxID=43433 RepID=UPI002220A48B|nr:ankyrin repeat-containing domain protein [Tricharina praecox]KAI5857543.1 ankyrin repeat-containing domain protein [Tricharina praecox]
MPLTTLPNELLILITCTFRARDLLNLTSTCRNLYHRLSALLPPIALTDHLRATPALKSALRRCCEVDNAELTLHLLYLSRAPPVNAWFSDTFGLETALHVSSAHGSLCVTRLLLFLGADVNARDIGRITPLHAAAAGVGCRGGHPEVVRLLLDSGAEVHAFAAGDASPLLFACVGGNTEVVRVLVKYGAEYAAHRRSQNNV